MSAKNLSRRDFLRASAGATAAAALTTLPSIAAASAPAAQGEEITLSLWGFAQNRTDWMENVIEELWQADNPNTTINIEVTPYADLWPKLQAAFVAGSAIPDIVDLEISAGGQYFRVEGDEPFLPLNDLIGDELDNLTLPSATTPWTVRGNIYGIGNEVNPVLLYYRHDIFDELGLDPEAPETWQEFVDTLGGPVTEAGYALGSFTPEGWEDFYIQYYQAGGQFFDEEGNVTMLDDDLAVEILTWQKNLVDSGVFMERPSGDAAYAAMNEDAFLTIWGAPWYQGFMKLNMPDLEGQWKMRYMPVWSEGGYLTVPRGGTGMGITLASPNAEAAWEFIRVGNLTVDGSMLAFRDLNLFPSYMPAWDREELLRTDDYFSGQQPGEYIATAAEEMAVVNQDPYWPLFVDSLGRLGVSPVMLDDADPATALAEVVDDFEFNK